MKKIVFIATLFIFCVISVKAQVKVQSDSLSNLKRQGKLNGNEHLYNPAGTKGLHVTQSPNRAAKVGIQNNTIMSSTSCNCWIPRDTSFHVVPFDGSGGSGGPGVPPNYANDDWSTSAITLPFNFCLYGTNVGFGSQQLFINNNGNVTFGSAYSTFSAVAFPSTQYVMVAPFWGDVETTNSGSGFVYYQLTPTHLIVQWDSVTCFQTGGATSPNASLKNTFQLIITDGNDSILPNGYNASFCYGDMQWTTGDASGATSNSGFGGTPATVGINKGNGTNYIQISLFGNNTSVFTNPAGNPVSGINWLSHNSFIFDACGATTNLPPLVLDNSNPCQEDTLTMYATDTLSQRVGFIGPEPTQSVTVNAAASALGSGFSVLDSNAGTTGSIGFMISGNELAPGYYNMSVTGTDNGVPPLNTTLNYVIHILPANITTGIKTTENKQVSIYPNPNNGSFVIEPNSTLKQLIQVYDVTGKIVLSQYIIGKTTIDASNLNEGVYSVSITGNQTKINKRLVIVK